MKSIFLSLAVLLMTIDGALAHRCPGEVEPNPYDWNAPRTKANCEIRGIRGGSYRVYANGFEIPARPGDSSLDYLIRSVEENCDSVKGINCHKIEKEYVHQYCLKGPVEQPIVEIYLEGKLFGNFQEYYHCQSRWTTDEGGTPGAAYKGEALYDRLKSSGVCI